jgi:hypothetical protein
MDMLDDRKKDGLRHWYRRPDVLDEARRLMAAGEYESLEEHIQMRALFPLSHHGELPAYLRDDDGKPLLPKNANPGNDLEEWRDAIEVGWEVVETELGMSRDQVHLAIKKQQEQSWEAFLRSVDERKRQRQGEE